MTSTALVNGRVLLDDGIVDDRAVLIDRGRIKGVLPTAEVDASVDRVDLQGGTLVPGFVDCQVNGGGGVLFNDEPTVEAIARIGEAHRSFGSTGFLPTLISDDLDVVRRAVAAVDAAIEAGVPGVLGIHIEGPFLNVRRKGIHRAEKIRDLDDEGFATLTGLKHGRTLVTLAPERTTPAMVRRLVDAGVVVSAGHTNGSYRAIRAALDAGLSGFTHLFNAMSPLTSREPGAVGAALEDMESWCGLIVDGHHVDPVVLRLALRCKPLDKLMLVTDAMPSVGLRDKSFVLQGQAIHVRAGVCVNADGTLAGSDLDMASAVRNAASMLDLPLADAVRMATRNPASFLRLDDEIGRIAPGYRANLALLDARLRVTKSWVDGRPAAPR